MTAAVNPQVPEFSELLATAKEKLGADIRKDVRVSTLFARVDRLGTVLSRRRDGGQANGRFTGPVEQIIHEVLGDEAVNIIRDNRIRRTLKDETPGQISYERTVRANEDPYANGEIVHVADAAPAPGPAVAEPQAPVIIDDDDDDDDDDDEEEEEENCDEQAGCCGYCQECGEHHGPADDPDEPPDDDQVYINGVGQVCTECQHVCDRD